MSFRVGDKVRILDDAFGGDTGTVVETDRLSKNFGYDYLVALDGDPMGHAPVPFDVAELEKLED